MYITYLNCSLSSPSVGPSRASNNGSPSRREATSIIIMLYSAQRDILNWMLFSLSTMGLCYFPRPIYCIYSIVQFNRPSACFLGRAFRCACMHASLHLLIPGCAPLFLCRMLDARCDAPISEHRGLFFYFETETELEGATLSILF